MSGAEQAPACPAGSDDLPTCSTGPFARLTWTLRQVAEILHLGGKTR